MGIREKDNSDNKDCSELKSSKMNTWDFNFLTVKKDESWFNNNQFEEACSYANWPGNQLGVID
jgi:hypothetical protein